MKNKATVLLLLFVCISFPTRGYSNVVCDTQMMDIVGATLTSAVDFLFDTVSDAITSFTEIFNDETIELKITDATVAAELKGQTAGLTSALTQHAVASAVTSTNDMWSPLSQSDFACTNECMTRNLAENSKGASVASDSFTSAVTNFNNSFTSQQNLRQTISTPYRNAAISGLADGRQIMPTGATATGTIQNTTAQIIALTNPLPAINLSGYGQDTPGRRHYETLRGLKNIALSLTQRILSRQAGNVYPAYNLAGDPWFHQIQASLGGSVGDIDSPGNVISDASSLAMQVKARFANPNWHLDLHRKTPTGGLRTIVAMNAVQLELKKQIHRANQDIQMIYALFNALEGGDYYQDQIEKFSGDQVIQ